MSRRPRREFTEEFKLQMVKLYNSGKPTVEIVKEYDFVYGAIGYHPEEVNDIPNNYLDLMKRYLSNSKIKAIGEIGLDYHYEGYSKEKQIYFFEKQLDFAKENNLPVIVHSRDAVEDTLNILKKHRPHGVVHCFSGSEEVAKEILDLDMYIGFTGVVTFKNSKKAVKSACIVPDNRLLIETDCPYMSPEPLRGHRCDSTMLKYIAAKLAECRNTDVNHIIDITCANAKALYNIE